MQKPALPAFDFLHVFQGRLDPFDLVDRFPDLGEGIGYLVLNHDVRNGTVKEIVSEFTAADVQLDVGEVLDIMEFPAQSL